MSGRIIKTKKIPKIHLTRSDRYDIVSYMSDTTLTEEQQVLRKQMIDALKQGVVTVIFTKVDGTQRTMRCSLNEAHLPPKPEPDPSTPAPVPPRTSWCGMSRRPNGGPST